MAENLALAWLAAFRSERSRRAASQAAELWREHRRAPGGDAEELLAGLAARLGSIGVGVLDCGFDLLPLHPEIYALVIVWSRGGAITRDMRTHAFIASVNPANSPMAAIKAGSPALRLRLDGDPEALAVPLMRATARRGANDFFIMPLAFGDGRRSFFWCAVDNPGGFTDGQIAAIEELAPLLAPRVEAASWEEATETLLDTYLGANAAARVLSGAFKRGTGEILDTVIWYSDMRGFTSLVDTRPMGEVIPILNRYFETLAGPVEDAGGEILKFIGDAMLAVFPSDGGGRAKRCEQALGAALAAIDALTGLVRDPGWPPLKSGIALHLGEVMYGNIGARARLDFTVIGPAVNETARVESLCKELGTPLLVTDTFRRAADGAELTSLGRHALRGVAQPVELFTVPRFTPVR